MVIRITKKHESFVVDDPRKAESFMSKYRPLRRKRNVSSEGPKLRFEGEERD